MPTYGKGTSSFSYPPRQRWVRDAQAYSVGFACRNSFSYPPLTRWVCEKIAERKTPSSGRALLVGLNITDPPLTRWVCEKLSCS